MLHLLRRILPSGSPVSKPQPRSTRPRFKPAIERLDDRITPTLVFGAATPFTVGSNPYQSIIADFNGDGRPDIASANGGSASVSVLLNTTPSGTATPTFATKQDFIVGTNPDGLAMGDFESVFSDDESESGAW